MDEPSYDIAASHTSRAFTFTGRLRSVRYAVQGVVTMLRTQHNAWVHAAATVAVIVLATIL